jgi:hypothetical protein
MSFKSFKNELSSNGVVSPSQIKGNSDAKRNTLELQALLKIGNF